MPVQIEVTCQLVLIFTVETQGPKTK